MIFKNTIKLVASLAITLPVLAFADDDKMHHDEFVVDSYTPECLDLTSDDQLKQLRIQADVPTKYQENDKPVIKATRNMTFLNQQNILFGYEGLTDVCGYYSSNNPVEIAGKKTNAPFMAFTAKMLDTPDKHNNAMHCAKAANAYLHLTTDHGKECVVTFKTLAQ